MQAQPCVSLLVRGGLVLLVLTANIAAPLNTDAGRLLLDGLGRGGACQSTVRVRIVSHPASMGGFRAVVGLAKGGPAEAVLEAPTQPHHCPVLSSLLVHSAPFFELAPAGLRTPLRC